MDHLVNTITYGLFRFAHEFARATPKFAAGISGYQIWALALFVTGLVAFMRRRNFQRLEICAAENFNIWKLGDGVSSPVFQGWGGTPGLPVRARIILRSAVPKAWRT